MNDALLLKYLKNELSESEIVRVLDWLDDDPKNRRHLDELDFISNAHLLATTSGRQAAGKRRPLWKKILKWSSVAAAVLAVYAVSGIWLAREIADREARRNLTTITTPSGQRMSVCLSDGTVVWLNAGAKLEYPPVFPRKNRRVKISGEAMFQVEHDARRPFIVETFACKAEVLGTKFNILADPEESYFSAALLEGRLRISNLDSDDELFMMSPDDVVEFVDGRLAMKRLDDHEDFLWIEGLLNLDNLSFQEVMRKIEKYYGVKIVVSMQNVPQIKYKGKIRVSDGVDYALKMLQMTSGFSYRRNDETNTIYIE